MRPDHRNKQFRLTVTATKRPGTEPRATSSPVSHHCDRCGHVASDDDRLASAAEPSPNERRQPPRQSSQIVSLDGDDWLLATDPKNVGRDEKWWNEPAPGGQADQGALDHPGRLSRLPRRGLVLARLLRRRPTRFPTADTCCGSGPWTTRPTSGSTATPVGSHEGGETPFVLDVTDAIQARRGQPAGGPRAESDARADRRHRARPRRRTATRPCPTGRAAPGTRAASWTRSNCSSRRPCAWRTVRPARLEDGRRSRPGHVRNARPGRVPAQLEFTHRPGRERRDAGRRRASTQTLPRGRDADRRRSCRSISRGSGN